MQFRLHVRFQTHWFTLIICRFQTYRSFTQNYTLTSLSSAKTWYFFSENAILKILFLQIRVFPWCTNMAKLAFLNNVLWKSIGNSYKLIKGLWKLKLVIVHWIKIDVLIYFDISAIKEYQHCQLCVSWENLIDSPQRLVELLPMETVVWLAKGHIVQLGVWWSSRNVPLGQGEHVRLTPLPVCPRPRLQTVRLKINLLWNNALQWFKIFGV